MKTQSFHNTIREEGTELARSERQASSQEERVLTFFQDRPWGGWSPFQIQRLVLPECPITSVRRAMTNLSNQGKLEKSNIMMLERYGKKNHYWHLAGVKDQMEMF